MQQRQNYFQILFKLFNLQKLKLVNIVSSLDDQETFNFVLQIFFNKALPLKILKLGDKLQLNSNLLNNLPDECTSTIEKLTLNSNIDQTLSAYQLLVPYFLNRSPHLISLCIKSQTQLNMRFFDAADGNYNLEQLKLHYKVSLDSGHLKFIYGLQNLKLLKLTVIDSSVFETEFFNEKQPKQCNHPCKLAIQISEIKEENTKNCFEKFIFGSTFKWSSLELQNMQSAFTEFSKIEEKNFPFLKEINLKFGLLYNSAVQLSEDALMEFGRNIIFNENSNLEILSMHQCHLKPAGIKALVRGAEEMRLRGKFKLPLKEFRLYYSLYLEEEGIKLLCENILFNESITMERIELEVINMNDEMMLNMCSASRKWLESSGQKHFSIRHFDIGRNEFIQSEEAWNQLLSTFVFSDLMPKLEVLFIHFMGIGDKQVRFISNKCRQYKGKLHLKRLNFFQNNAITEEGWVEISEGFLFHENLDVEELNLLSTMLDGESKIEAVYSAAVKKAKGQKLPLHTLICGNITLKTLMFPLLCEKPKDFLEPKDLPVKVDYKYTNCGYIDGVPYSFGQITRLINKVLYTQENFSNGNQWLADSGVRFGIYHVSFFEGFLLKVNQFISEFNGVFIVDNRFVDQLLTLFSYISEDNGHPYPLPVFFTEQAFQFYESDQCNIKQLIFLSKHAENCEFPNSEFIIKLCKRIINNKFRIKRIQLEYKVDDRFIVQMLQNGFSENEIIQLIKTIPPSRCMLKRSLPKTAIKMIKQVLADYELDKEPSVAEDISKKIIARYLELFQK